MKHFDCEPCNRCHKTPCACPVPQLGIDEVCSTGNSVDTLRYTINGTKAEYNYTGLVHNLQTDTSLSANPIARVLDYMAERHRDSISAQELGAILHLSDLGDVTSSGAKDGSMLMYQKSSNCGEGCVGAGDTWKIWNSLDEQTSSATYPMVFSADGKPKTLERPQNPDKQYLLGWNGKNQLSYFRVAQATTKPAQGGPVYYDESTGTLTYVKES